MDSLKDVAMIPFNQFMRIIWYIHLLPVYHAFLLGMDRAGRSEDETHLFTRIIFALWNTPVICSVQALE